MNTREKWEVCKISFSLIEEVTYIQDLSRYYLDV